VISGGLSTLDNIPERKRTDAMLATLGSNDWVTPFFAVLSRGDLYFFSTLRIVVVFAIFFLWLRTLVWIDKDANWASLPREFWTYSSLVSCAAAMFVLFFFPNFGYPFGLSASCGRLFSW
jgi:hypothetical protein